MQLFNKEKLKIVTWAERNKIIASHLLPNKTVLDLGCGGKDFLNHYTPLDYCGVDGLDTADIVLDLNGNFTLPGGWDYVINSGILEYLDNIENYFQKIKPLGSEFIFTWWPKTGTNRISQDQFKILLSLYFTILKEDTWGDQKIYFCI